MEFLKVNRSKNEEKEEKASKEEYKAVEKAENMVLLTSSREKRVC